MIKKLKLLGELISTKISRNIIKLLSVEELYINKISQKLNIRYYFYSIFKNCFTSNPDWLIIEDNVPLAISL